MACCKHDLGLFLRNSYGFLCVSYETVSYEYNMLSNTLGIMNNVIYDSHDLRLKTDSCVTSKYQLTFFVIDNSMHALQKSTISTDWLQVDDYFWNTESILMKICKCFREYYQLTCNNSFRHILNILAQEPCATRISFPFNMSYINLFGGET